MIEGTTPTQRAAVIDCGTNMFTVLIAEGSGDAWERKHVLRQPVFIGQGGFQNRSIRSDRFARGLDALQTFHQALGNYNVKDVRVVGTSALRGATNGTAFAVSATSESSRSTALTTVSCTTLSAPTSAATSLFTTATDASVVTALAASTVATLAAAADVTMGIKISPEQEFGNGVQPLRSRIRIKNQVSILFLLALPRNCPISLVWKGSSCVGKASH